MRLRRLAIAIAAATSLLTIALGTSPATFAAGLPVDKMAAVASAYQNATVAQALANNPSGVRIAPNQVEWNHGTVIMTVPASPNAPAAPDTCPSGWWSGQWTCVYYWRHFAGTRLQFQNAGFYQDLYQYGGFNWHTWSYSNTRGQRAYLNENANHHNPGAQYCMTGNSHGGDIFGPWSDDRWIYLSSNYNRC